MHVSHLICQLALSELAPYQLRGPRTEGRGTFSVLSPQHSSLSWRLPGLHRADPSTPLDEQSSIVAAQYSIALWWSQSVEIFDLWCACRSISLMLYYARCRALTQKIEGILPFSTAGVELLGSQALFPDSARHRSARKS
jgi:hypothetical protein